MPQHDQTLSDTTMGILDRWLKYQGVVDEVFAERERQVEQWGEGMPPLGTGGPSYVTAARWYREQCQLRADAGTVTMADVILEEVFEALAEGDTAKARDELIQVIAVGFKMVEGIDRGATATEGISAG